MIAIVDYGMGNVASISSALQALGHQVMITDSLEQLEHATHIILPGVGAFSAAVDEIDRRGLREPMVELARRKPFLGICLGMQLLFTEGDEGGLSYGLDLIPGRIHKINTPYRLPHIGWNSLDILEENKDFTPFQDQQVYFVHTYAVATEPKYIVATTEYGTVIPAIVQNRHVWGMQFHPEKSGDVGGKLLKIFLEADV